MEPDFLQAYKKRYERASLSSPFLKKTRFSNKIATKNSLELFVRSENKMEPDFLQAYRKRYERASLSSPFSKKTRFSNKIATKNSLELFVRSKNRMEPDFLQAYRKRYERASLFFTRFLRFWVSLPTAVLKFKPDGYFFQFFPFRTISDRN